MLGALAALVLATFVTLLVVAAGSGGKAKNVTAGSSTTSSSSSTTTSTSSTTTTAPPDTTTTASATTTSGAPPTTAVQPVVTGQGATLRGPTAADSRVMSPGQDCHALADDGWQATCGTAAAKGGQLVWLTETQQAPSGRTGHRALVLRRTASPQWDVVLEARDDNGVRFSDIRARVEDVSGDGSVEIAFGFRLTTGDGALALDLVEGPGNVVVHRDLPKGVARVSSGQLDTWRR
ncbi:MAG: hypothetical protein QOJ09_2296, partial [Actinomycetota bacterium]|nr:hypothetical protein [Actinomycetota bacterium]